MRKHSLSIVIGIIALLVLGVVFAFLFYKGGISAVSKESEEVVFDVESGQTATDVLNNLEKAGLVKNALCGKLYMKLNHIGNFKANSYLLNKNMDLEKIFYILEHPTDEYLLQMQVTILEGNSMPLIAETIATAMNKDTSEVLAFLNDKEFLNTLVRDYWFLTDEILQDGIKYPLEGYLYPETYLFNNKVTLESVIRESLDAMDNYLTPKKAEIEATGWSVHEFLTFASIVERESLFDEDRPKIAGVFTNRLKIDMLLQSDITVNYAWERTGVDVSYSHLEIDSPYNTYKYIGLPIGPISTVSSVTVEACLDQEEHAYLYFFAKEDGTVIYSETLEEHNAAVKKYQWY